MFSLQSIGKGSKVFSVMKPANSFPTKQPREDFARSKQMYHPPHRQYFQLVNCNSVPPSPPLLENCFLLRVRRSLLRRHSFGTSRTPPQRGGVRDEPKECLRRRLGSPKIQIYRETSCRKFQAEEGILSKLMGFRLIWPKPIKYNNAIVSKIDPLFLISRYSVFFYFLLLKRMLWFWWCRGRRIVVKNLQISQEADSFRKDAIRGLWRLLETQVKSACIHFRLWCGLRW